MTQRRSNVFSQRKLYQYCSIVISQLEGSKANPADRRSYSIDNSSLYVDTTIGELFLINLTPTLQHICFAAEYHLLLGYTLYFFVAFLVTSSHTAYILLHYQPCTHTASSLHLTMFCMIDYMNTFSTFLNIDHSGCNAPKLDCIQNAIFITKSATL